MRRYRALSTVLFAILVSALVGGLFGRSALAVDDKVPDHYKTFTAALDAIETNYVGRAESDGLVYGAIRGMLGTLDPHSSFFDPREYARMRERQEGRYYGLGIQIQNTADNDVMATGVFEGSPAHKAGVRRGDVFARIGTEDAGGWGTERAQQNLRGPRGTVVHIEVRRRGYEQLIPLDVARDEVYIPTVPAAFMIDATTGYIQLHDFGENTDRDLKRGLRDLASKGMRRLLLDIRGNPGGPLDQAIKVSNEFLPRGRMIVYTRGRISNSDSDYRASEEGEFTTMPLVVLTNRNSASAAEIVSGALQDHDRGYIVGETTFGKALVQSVYRISGNAGLALTTAHYYTPSGRLIQRPWDSSFDQYLSYSQRDQNVTPEHSPSDLKHTTVGRPVYSGGGIEPDRRIAGPVGSSASDTTGGWNPSRFGRLLSARQEFAIFAMKFTADGDTRVTLPSTGRKTVKPNFVVDEAMLAEFREQLKAERIVIDEAAYAQDLEFIKAMLRFEIDAAVFSVADAWRHRIVVDPQGQVALAQFSEAQKLLDLSKPATRARALPADRQAVPLRRVAGLGR
ncbi:MAG: S41 family peptidase [Vicinamibacterales bacterium]